MQTARQGILIHTFIHCGDIYGVSSVYLGTVLSDSDPAANKTALMEYTDSHSWFLFSNNS